MEQQIVFHDIKIIFFISVSGLFKQAWNEIPEVVGSTFMAVVGVSMAGFGLYNYYCKDGDNRRYKMEYTVYRPDDLKVAKIRKD